MFAPFVVLKGNISDIRCAKLQRKDSERKNSDSSLVTSVEIFLMKIKRVAEALLFLTLASNFSHLVTTTALMLQTLLSARH